ncbi:MAG: imidazoleglycerol-phosphate dehydratase HisB [Deltaproteobacteria bacterium]|nr:imidazoleglycerol-phosphate dehydratase HisB [Deltaproteobacteria bacterium]
MSRTGRVERATSETKVTVSVDLDGEGRYQIDTGIPFFDHMLSHVAKQGLLDVTIEAKGDLEVDFHHTVEDVGLSLGDAFAQALGNKIGTRRYGSASLPMEEAIADVAVDFGGRPYLVYRVELTQEKVGGFDVSLAKEFLRSFANRCGMNLHVTVRYGEDSHHVLEAIFKGFGLALRDAVSVDPRRRDVPSTKGTL